MSKYSIACGIVDKVMEEARKEFMTVIEDAEKKAMTVIEDAEKKAMKEVERLRMNKEKEMNAMRRGILGDADLRARNMKLKFVEEAVKMSMERALDELTDGSLRNLYEEVLPELLEEGIEMIGGEDFIVSCNDRDLELVRSMIRRIKGRRISVEGGLDCKGGVIVRSRDGAVIYINTLEDRVERARPAIRRKMMKLLGGGRDG